MVSRQGSQTLAIVTAHYHYTDSIKSMLVVASKLVDEVARFPSEQVIGGQRLLSCLLLGLAQEAERARVITGLNGLEKVDNRIKEAASMVQLRQYPAANRCIAEALMLTTTCAQQAVEVLKKEGLWQQWAIKLR